MIDLAGLLGSRPSDDLDRVLGLALARPGSPEDAATAWTLILSPTRARPLRPAQGAFLDAVARASSADPGPWGARGAVGLLGCGHGKTLCAQLAASAAAANPRDCGAVPARRLLVLPAALRPQLRADVREWREHYPSMAFTSEDGGPGSGSWLSYEQLSGPVSSNLLDDLSPDLLVLDEAHMLGNPESARWRRLARYVSTRPSTRVVVLSGTLSARGLREMAHLFHAALRDWSPLPSDGTLAHLAACVDVGTEPSRDDEGVAARVVGWSVRQGAHAVAAAATGSPREAARWAVFERVRTAPGVAVAHGVAADVSLRISVWSGPTQPPAIVAALTGLRDRWELPDGTELVDALEHHRHARTLALGWYQRWVPGAVDPGWLAARRRWAGEVRRLLLYDVGASAALLDSPALVARAAAAGRLDARASAAWHAWAVADRPRGTTGPHPGPRVGTPWDMIGPFAGWPEPPTKVVWLDGGREYLGACAAGPAGWESMPSVVWVGSPTAGAALSSSLGAPHYGAGSSQPPDPAPAVPSRPSRIVVSHHVHGKGWNGQGWSRALVVEPPDGPAAWEQLLARQHRPGARRDVEVVVLAPTPESRVALLATAMAARYARDTLGQPQRLLLADWSWDGSGPPGDWTH